MNPDHRAVGAATVSALLAAAPGAGVARLESLLRDAVERLGPRHPVTFLVESRLLVARGPDEPAGESLAAWSDLLDRIGGHLADDHPTRLAIRSHHLRAIRRRGQPGDLDRVVDLRREDLDRRVRGGVADTWTGLARTDLALALLDRARFGGYDLEVRQPGAGTDVAEAWELVEHEHERRAAAYGVTHALTWHAQGIQARISLVLARDEPEHRYRLRAAALDVAEELLGYEWRRAGRHTHRALRFQWVRAEALLGLGRPDEAEGEARLASVLALGYRRADAATGQLVLARAIAPRDRTRALATAERGLCGRLDCCPAYGHQVAQARALVQALTTDAAELP